EQPDVALRSAQAETEPEFDPATLPPIDSIVAGSDIRAFLQKGVPAELTKAALRRGWTTDPAIRDFIGIAEHQWDCTDPTSMPGFGPLEATGDLPQLVAQAMGKLQEAAAPSSLREEGTVAAASSGTAPDPAVPAQEIADGQGATVAAAPHHPEP